MSELGASNVEVIAEFRANEGRVGGFFARETLLLITTTGRKSGKQYTTPLSYQRDGDDLVVIGANLASMRVSDWYLNVLASPRVVIEVGAERYQAVAQVIVGARRDRILESMRSAWNASRALNPDLPEMPVMSSGEIPVVALTSLVREDCT